MVDIKAGNSLLEYLEYYIKICQNNTKWISLLEKIKYTVQPELTAPIKKQVV